MEENKDENLTEETDLGSEELDLGLDDDFDPNKANPKKMNFAFRKYLIELVILVVLGFLIGFFVTELVFNNYFSYYEFNIQTETTPNYLFSEEYFNGRVKALDDYYNYSKDSKYKLTANIEYNKIPSVVKYEEVSANNYVIRIEARIFKDSYSSKSQSILTAESRCKTNIDKILNLSIPAYETHLANIPTQVAIGNVLHMNENNPYIYGGLSAGLMALISISLFFIVYRSRNKDYFLDISDNEKIFRTPFHKKYWTGQLRAFKNVKDLVILAMLFGLMLVCKLIPIPSGFGTLGISFTFLFFSIIGMVYGPMTGLIIGIFSDVLGFFIFPSGGAFFPGYTLDAMMAGFTYGICFYKTKVTFTKCLLARLVVNLIINVIFGSLWYMFVYVYINMSGATFEEYFNAYKTYLLLISLPKNLIYLLPQSILLFVVLKAMARPLSAFGLIDMKVKKHITIF